MFDFSIGYISGQDMNAVQAHTFDDFSDPRDPGIEKYGITRVETGREYYQ